MPITVIDSLSPEAVRFDELCRRALTEEHVRSGIGTLGERTLHAVLKRYLEPDETLHEQKVGRYVADIRRGDEIVEIQTRSFFRMRGKLAAFLKDHRVRIVYPIAQTKYVSWVDPETGETSDRRRSPKKGRMSDVLYELYALRPMLPAGGLSLELIFLDIEEFRLLTGWDRTKKRGATRCERIPTAVRQRVLMEKPEDFRLLVPEELPETFDSAAFARAAHLTRTTAGYGLRTLVTLGVIEVTGKKGNSYLYQRKETDHGTVS